MIELYCKLIVNRIRSFDHVRDEFKVQVEARLLELGYDTNGNPIVTEE